MANTGSGNAIIIAFLYVSIVAVLWTVKSSINLMVTIVSQESDSFVSFAPHEKVDFHKKISATVATSNKTIKTTSFNANFTRFFYDNGNKSFNTSDSSSHGSSSLFVPQPPKRKFSQKQFWKYDEAAPATQTGKIHFLTSIPEDFRVRLDLQEAGETMNFTEALNNYASNPNNTFPNKVHLVEINPSIAKLPESYLRNNEWLKTFENHHGIKKQSNRMPFYISTYRVTDEHNCFDDQHSMSIKYGNNWENWKKEHKNQRTDYLGFALLDEELDIVADIVVTLKGAMFRKDYQDYRVFNLRGGKGEQLYLTTDRWIVPIQLSLLFPNDPEKGARFITDSSYVKLQSAFPLYGLSTKKQFSFEVWARSDASCTKPPKNYKGGIKNLLYFNEITSPTRKNDTETSVAFLPNGNPNRVHSMNLNQKCDKVPIEDPPYMNSRLPYPKPSFETMDKQIYPRWDLFLGDRGSACCTRIKKKQIPASLSTLSASDTESNHTSLGDNDTLLVAVVHVKTKLQKNLPEDIPSNIYLSRFIAFLPREPYTIVARSGLFCLGNPEEDEMAGKKTFMDSRPYHNYFVQSRPLKLGNETLASCPKIHFVMGMIDKVKTNQQDNDSFVVEQVDSVIITYGVQDCLSRFIEVKKSDIIELFWGN